MTGISSGRTIALLVVLAAVVIVALAAPKIYRKYRYTRIAERVESVPRHGVPGTGRPRPFTPLQVTLPPGFLLWSAQGYPPDWWIVDVGAIRMVVLSDSITKSGIFAATGFDQTGDLLADNLESRFELKIRDGVGVGSLLDIPVTTQDRHLTIDGRSLPLDGPASIVIVERDGRVAYVADCPTVAWPLDGK